MKKLLFGLWVTLTIVPVYAQENWCASDEHNAFIESQLSAEDAALAKKQALASFARANFGDLKESGNVITVPVVVHVYHDNCEGNISKEQVLDGIRVMNEDFARINADTSQTRSLFKPVTGDAMIQFELARIDPDGNCTEGINRVNTPYATQFPYGSGSGAAKALSQWGYGKSRKYMNIWLVNSIESSGSGTILGYATLPNWGTNNISYGLVVRSDQWGNIGTSRADGRTATHEMGHALGLRHTFQGGCGGNCDQSGDYLCDTPPSSQATYGCNTNQNTCSNDANRSSASVSNPYTSNVVDQIENYMSYDRCQNMFTNQQIAVMRDNLTSIGGLVTMTSQNNLVATGTDSNYVPQVCRPIAQLCQEEVQICAGTSVTFSDESYNGPSSSRTWTFNGGTPATSSDSTVTVTYNTPGVYDVKLSVSNTDGSTNVTEQDLVRVLSSEAQLDNWRYDENFDNQARFDTLWTIDNPSGGRAWELTSRAYVSSNKSIYLQNYANAEDQVDLFYSPTYDISSVLSPRMSFKVAYARKSQTTIDILRIYSTSNCGLTWSFVGLLTGTQLESVANFVIGDFEPTSSEWREINLTLSSSLKDKDNVQFKFELTSGGGNNIYIDDLNIESTTGLEEEDALGNVAVYPNPANAELFVDFSNVTVDPSRLRLLDMSGRTVNDMSLQGGMMGDRRFSLDVSDFAPGIYFLEMTTENGSSASVKVVVH